MRSEVRHRELSRKPQIFLFVQLNGWGPICGNREHSEKKKKEKKKLGLEMFGLRYTEYSRSYLKCQMEK